MELNWLINAQLITL